MVGERARGGGGLVRETNLWAATLAASLRFWASFSLMALLRSSIEPIFVILLTWGVIGCKVWGWDRDDGLLGLYTEA